MLTFGAKQSACGLCPFCKSHWYNVENNFCKSQNGLFHHHLLVSFSSSGRSGELEGSMRHATLCRIWPSCETFFNYQYFRSLRNLMPLAASSLKHDRRLWWTKQVLLTAQTNFFQIFVNFLHIFLQIGQLQQERMRISKYQNKRM